MVVTLTNMAEVLWLLGYPTQALRKTHEALTMVQDQSRIFDLALTLSYALVPYVFHREGRIVLERAEAVLDQPRGSPHRSHFHMRIFCARDDVPSCEDEPPYFPWVPRTP